MKRIRTIRCLLLVLAMSVSALSQNQGTSGENDGTQTKSDGLPEFIKANYTKHEYRILMRDGIHLFTAVYVPKDASPQNQYPILLTRTPYSVSPYGEERYPRDFWESSELLTRSKYIVVRQDVRGRLMSEGDFVNMRPEDAAEKGGQATDESTDTWDTIDWLVRNIPDNNGKVGMLGISYDGFYTACGEINSHPALKAISPQAPQADWFIGDDFHRQGALIYLQAYASEDMFPLQPAGLVTKFPRPKVKFGTTDSYELLLGLEPLSAAYDKYFTNNLIINEAMQHPNYDAFWQARDLLPKLKNVKAAVLTVGGWFDLFNLYGALHVYAATEKNNPGISNTLVMGPWCHGCWAFEDGDHLGNIHFNSQTSIFYREKIEFPFFEHHLKGKEDPKLPEAYVFETGSNEWRQYETWPPKNTTKKALFFGPNGRLSFEPPGEAQGFDEYISDPAKPVPYMDETGPDMNTEYMIADQRLQGRRTDVLVYQTKPLTEDVTIVGPVQPILMVSTTGTDSDFVVKLIDAYPPDTHVNSRGGGGSNSSDLQRIRMGSYEQLVRGEPMRGRYRNSFEKPEPFTPSVVSKVEFVMADVNHTFRRGHRIMVQVQSSWFPLVDLNPQKFVDIYTAKAADFQKATERIYREKGAASRVNLLVLENAVPGKQ
jgi:putative CocE/NonD family hydrolase